MCRKDTVTDDRAGGNGAGDTAFPFGANGPATGPARPVQPDGPGAADPAPGAPPDPFDPAALRLTHDFAALGVKKTLLTVPVRKPDKSWWVRVHPGEEYALQTAVIELRRTARRIWSPRRCGPAELRNQLSRRGLCSRRSIARGSSSCGPCGCPV